MKHKTNLGLVTLTFFTVIITICNMVFTEKLNEDVANTNSEPYEKYYSQ